jgi:hypothetical protein
VGNIEKKEPPQSFNEHTSHKHTIALSVTFRVECKPPKEAGEWLRAM